MAARSVRAPAGRIDDMLEAIAGIAAAIAQDSMEAIMGDWTRRRAVERGFEIISEASRHIPAEIKQTEPEIAWSRIAGLGNVLRHDYADVSFPLLFRAFEDEFPPLEAALHRMLARL